VVIRDVLDRLNWYRIYRTKGLAGLTLTVVGGNLFLQRHVAYGCLVLGATRMHRLVHRLIDKVQIHVVTVAVGRIDGTRHILVDHRREVGVDRQDVLGPNLVLFQRWNYGKVSDASILNSILADVSFKP